ncbi:LPS export ABC transporter permease LptG [Sessilibacter sp. MAH2]
MRKLSFYIAKTIAGAIFVVLLVIVGLDTLFSLIDEFTDLKNGYTAKDAFLYVLTSIPGRLFEFVPFSSLIGCLIGLGLLAGTSELVVMRAAGISVLRITGLVLRPVLLLVLLGILIGEFIAPITDQIAESNRAVARGEEQVFESDSGLWHRDGNEFMHFNAVQPNGKIFGLNRYVYNDAGDLVRTSHAELAIYADKHWVEEDVEEKTFFEDHIETTTYHSRAWDTRVSPQLLNVLVLPEDSLSIRDLYTFATFRQSQGLPARKYWLTFWEKVLQPFATISLVLIAVSFIFGPLRQVTTGFRVFTGVMVGVAFKTSQTILGPSSLVFGFSPLIAVAIPILICATAGVWVLSRYR